MKVVFNACYGGFSLSAAACQRLGLEHSGRDTERDDPKLVAVVEELGEASWGDFAELAIRDIPAGSCWRIDEYDGMESVMLDSEYEWKVAT